jgi:PAS domain S-box-containing protein
VDMSPICKSVLSGLEEAVLVIDASGQIQYLNPAAEKLTGYSLKDAAEKAIPQLADEALSAKGYSDDCLKRSSCQGTFSLGQKNFIFSASPLMDGSEVLGSAVYLRPAPAFLPTETGIGQNERNNERDDAQEELRKRDRILAGVVLATNQLLVAEERDLAINQALEILGCSAEVDRVCIFQNLDAENGFHKHKMRYEWCRDGFGSRVRGGNNDTLAYDQFPQWYDTLKSGSHIRGSAREFPKVIMAFLEDRDVLSLVAVPIFVKDLFWGFIGFDDCRSERTWTWSEISILFTMAGAFGGAMARWQTEQELRESEEKYRELVECSNSIIMRRDASGRITFFNDFAQRFFGFRESEILGKNVVGTIVPEIDSTGRNLQEMVEDIGKHPEQYATNANENMRSNGERVWVAWTNRPICNERGEVVELLCVGNDITDRKRAEEQLEASHKQLSGIIEFLPDATFVVDKGHKVIAWNKAIEEMTGVPKGDILGQGDCIYSSLFYGKKRPMLIDLIGADINNISKEYFDVKQMDGRLCAGAHAPMLFEGKGAYVWAAASPIFDRYGHAIGAIESIRDITKHKIAEEEVKRKDILLAGVAAAANSLLVSCDYDIEIDQAMEILCLSANVDRVYLFENQPSPDGAFSARQKYAWCREEMSPPVDDDNVQDLRYEYCFSRWHSKLSLGKAISGPSRDFPEPERTVIEQQGVMSLIVVPISIEGKFWGFIVFEDCHSKRTWSKIEISILRVASGSIGAAIERRKRDEELRGTRDFLENLIDHANAPIIVWNPSFKITRFNRAFERLTGYHAETVLGKHLEILFPLNNLGKSLAYIRRALSGERWEAVEIPILRQDGTVRTVLWNSATLYDSDGKTVLATIAQGQDITERKIVEEELRRTRDYLENLIGYANAPIIVWDPGFRITRFNRAFERLTGLSADEVLGKHLEILFPVESQRKSQDHIQRTLSGERWEAVEIPILRKDGSVRTVLWNSATIYDKDGETVLATIAQGQDITERKAAEEQVQFQASLLDQVHNAVIATDLSGVITYWNKHAEALHQWTAEEAIGRSIAETTVREGMTERMHQVMGQIASCGYCECELQVRRKDGSTFPAYYTFNTLKNSDGRNSGFVGVSIDITERKAAEENLRMAKERAETATKAKSQFLASMSHEIRTPMNAVIGLTGLLLNTDLSPEQRDYVETIRSSGDALMTIITDILDFSKIEGDKMELETQPLDMVDCIEESMDLIAQSAVEKGLNLSYSVDSRVPHRIVGDLTRLRQVLVNLLSNAVKFTERGEISILVTSQPSGKRHEILFAIKDTGIGIAPERMDRLFQFFSQVDMSINRKYGGTGLGLAISKRLVEMMDGTIWVESEPGSGSTFYFTIAAEAAPISAEELKGIKVLVVTSNEGLSKYLSDQLRNFSVQSVICSPLQIDDRKIMQYKPDLLIIDMDAEEGETFLQRMNSAKFPPMVALGSHKGDDRIFSGTLAHPIRPSSLTDILAKALRKPIKRSMSILPSIPREGKTIRILLAEDNLVNQKVALRMLERLGYRADVAANGSEAIAALKLQPYDVVLMDVQMPEMDGLIATRRIRSMKTIRQPYVIAMTAYATKGDREACLSAGMNDYIAKPVRMEELEAALRLKRDLSPAVDRSALEELRKLQMDDEPDIVQELIGMYLERGPSRIAALRDALISNNPQALYREAHDLKSSSAILGAMRLSAIFKELEAMGRSGSLETASELIEKAETEFRLVRDALEAEMDPK